MNQNGKWGFGELQGLKGIFYDLLDVFMSVIDQNKEIKIIIKKMIKIIINK